MIREMEDIFLKHSIKITEMKNTKSDRETTQLRWTTLRHTEEIRELKGRNRNHPQ